MVHITYQRINLLWWGLFQRFHPDRNRILLQELVNRNWETIKASFKRAAMIYIYLGKCIIVIIAFYLSHSVENYLPLSQFIKYSWNVYHQCTIITRAANGRILLTALQETPEICTRGSQ